MRFIETDIDHNYLEYDWEVFKYYHLQQIDVY